MKSIIFASFLLCLARTAAAQSNQQTDSTPPVQGWVQADTSGVLLGNTLISIYTMPSLDTVWAGGGSPIWSLNSNLYIWRYAPTPISGLPFFATGSLGFFEANADTIYRTTNAGQTWDTVKTGMGPTSITGCSFVTDQVGSNLGVCYVAAGEIGFTNDSGKIWSWQAPPVNTNPFPQYGGVNAISFADPYDAIAVGGPSSGPLDGMSGGAGCWITHDQGITWKQMFSGDPTLSMTTEPSGYPGHLDGVYDFNLTTAVAVGSHGIIRTTSGGNGWDSVYGGGWSAVDFKGATGFVAGGGGSILGSTDSGKTWSLEVQNIPGGLFYLKMYDSLHAVATGGNGAILVTSNGGKAWVNFSPQPPSLILSSYPNPATSEITIQYILPTPQHVTLAIYDMTGVLVTMVLSELYLDAGQRITTVPVSQLASGSYIYKLQSEQYDQSGTFTVVH